MYKENYRELKEKFQDKKFGFLSPLTISKTQNDIYRALIKTSSFSFKTNKQKILFCTGLGLTLEEAEVRCFFEGVERYVFLVTGSLDQSFLYERTIKPERDSFLNPKSFHCISDELISTNTRIKNIFNNHEKNIWHLGKTFTNNIDNSLDIYLPAGLISFDRNIELYPNTTNGWGAGNDLRFAFSAALYEAIERDAIMYSWWSGRDLYELDVGLCIEHSAEIKEYISRCQFDPACLKIRLHPTLLGDFAVSASFQKNSNSPSDAPEFCMAGSYEPNILLSVVKAIKELCGVYFKTTRPLDPTSISLNAQTFDETISDFADHIELYRHPSSKLFLNNFSHERAATLITRLPNPIAENAEQVNALAKQLGHEIAFCDMTTADVKKFGIYVVKVISPSFIPLNPSHWSRPIKHQRFQNLTYIHPYPHPFP